MIKKTNQTKLKTLLTIFLVAVLTLSGLCPAINKAGVLTAHADEEELSEEEKARKEASEWQDRYMRLHAEWDTYRRRTAEQRAEEAYLQSAE